MATSVVYSSIFGAVLASLSALTAEMVLFDTAVVGMTAELKDPIALLFSARPGGGTDILENETFELGGPQPRTGVLIEPANALSESVAFGV